ncbi:unnamed protein product [Medioppia subpectinata]|uniref:Peptidase M14 domain-containing protein n=1 Tax=Medioppia subpectinata TaxID=1979941 RepID=A0A7R9Q3H5_9ACAR|nr:unnamed protein product [Medioppia subpectinata]CAG2111281.1 unnamed protein product [Medioppia subpectinata]
MVSHSCISGNASSTSNVDFFADPTPDMSPFTALVGPEGRFLQALNASNISYKVVVNNFQSVIDREWVANTRQSGKVGFDYDNKYNTYEDITTELKRIGSAGGKAKYGSVGKSYEGREIPYLTITKPGGTNKKTIFFECGIHAREWVAVAACLWVTNQLVTTTTYDNLLDKYEFIIVPTLNPDGYVYTHTVNRKWRKTRSKSGLCFGADPNRNWDAAFCETGASTDPCDDKYCGKSAFSEPETKAMSELIATKASNTAGYFSIHCFGQLFMYPWGHKAGNPPNYAQLDKLAYLGVNAIKATNNVTYTPDVASGCATDYVYDKLKIQMAFAIELRPDRSHPDGFILDPKFIKPVSTEAWNGLRAVIENLDK